MLKTTLKVLFVLSILGYLYLNGDIDFNLLSYLKNQEKAITVYLLALLINIIILSERFRVLLDYYCKEKNNFFLILKGVWIGQFFSTFIPSSFSGDVLKGVYLKRNGVELQKRTLAFCLFTDRFIAMISMLFISLLVTFFSGETLFLLGDHLKQIEALNMILFIGCIFILYLVYFNNNFTYYILNLFKNDFLMRARSFLEQGQILAGLPKIIVIKVFLWTLLSQTICIYGMWYILNSVTSSGFTLIFVFLLAPLSVIVTSLPFAPLGLGAGHLLFANLFQMIGISDGATLFNIVLLHHFVINLIGAYPFITNKFGYSEKALS